MFDLDAYLARVALDAAPAPDPAGLARVQHAHRLAIAFENLDVILGRPVRIDTASVFEKLVRRRRGGYCFEHNRLFLDALEALGFTARPLLARVWLAGAQPVPPRTHVLALVRFGAEEWIADAGFGGGHVPPLPLADGAEAVGPDGARHRLARDPLHGWMIAREGEDQYSFTVERIWPGDVALSHHWVRSAAESRFVRGPIVSIVLPEGRAALDGTRYRRRDRAGLDEATIADPGAYRMRLGGTFGIDLTADEVAALGLFERAPGD